MTNTFKQLSISANVPYFGHVIYKGEFIVTNITFSYRELMRSWGQARPVKV